jgi:hypothetical protein
MEVLIFRVQWPLNVLSSLVSLYRSKFSNSSTKTKQDTYGNFYGWPNLLPFFAKKAHARSTFNALSKGKSFKSTSQTQLRPIGCIIRPSGYTQCLALVFAKKNLSPKVAKISPHYCACTMDTCHYQALGLIPLKFSSTQSLHKIRRLREKNIRSISTTQLFRQIFSRPITLSQILRACYSSAYQLTAKHPIKASSRR